jgi:hypothetical protein
METRVVALDPLAVALGLVTGLALLIVVAWWWRP